MSDIAESPDVLREGILDLAPPFWGKPRIATVLLAFLEEIQDLEDSIANVINDRILDNANAARLKILGAIVGEARYERATEEYRLAIRGRIRANKSTGQIEDILAVWSIVTGGAPIVRVTEVSRGIVLDIGTSALTPAIARVVRDSAGAGVAVAFRRWEGWFPLTADGGVTNLTTLTYSGSGETAYPAAWVE